MKLNGKINIITDNDIVTTGKHAGSNLNSVIENIEDEVTNLKRNVKFIYTNGSVGGGGSGGSSVTKWAITATLGGKTISNGNIISLTPGENSYPLVISISGGSSSYNVTYRYGRIERSVNLNADNNWRHSIQLELNDNGTISIEATDNILVKNVYADYISNPYSFGDLKLVDQNRNEYPTNDIFIDTAVVSGLGIICDYNIAINAKTTYDWYFNEVYQEDYSGEIDGISAGTFVFPISDEYLRPEMANVYNARLTITIQPENQDYETVTKNVAFNLIPNTIYLKLSPQTGIIYDSIQEEDYYEYNTNREIAFNCRIYNGPNTGKTGGTIRAVAEGGESEEITGYAEGTTVTVKILFRTPGWKAVTFYYNLEGSGSVTKYLYCRQVESEYNWFKKAVPTSKNYYRGWEEQTCYGMDVTNNTYVQMTTASEATNYAFQNSSEGCNLLLNLGIQYNTINDYREPIATFYNNAGNPFATIYQNKIVFESVYSSAASCQFFLNKEKDFNPGEPDNYHLITIALSSVWRDRSQSLDYNEITVYLDGVLQGAVNSFTPATVVLGGITLYPGSYSINHIDASYFAPTVDYSRILYDVDVNYYWYSYKSKSRSIIIDSDTTSILNFLYDVQTKQINYSITNNLVKVDSTLYDNVAKHCDIPTLVFRTNRWNTDYEIDIIDWMNTAYQDTSSPTSPSKYKIELSEVRWGKNRTATGKIIIPISVGTNTHFYIKLQGSSTMGNKSKNFTFGLEPGSDLAQNITPIFSPNFVADDPNTFLHEKEWTLKADVVDSSHTNNVAMGRFVNNHNNFNYSIEQTGADELITSHVRKCLDGFPVLVYLEAQSSNVTDTYFLGVYSFNLGRDSYFNLGYSDLSQLDPNYLTDASNNTFSFTAVGAGDSRGINPIEGFVAAEVQDNVKFWDFSQYDESVLFSRNNENANFMFGDIKTAAGYVNTERDIKNFVKSVAGAGGFLFKSIDKSLDPVHSYLDENDNIVENHMQDNEVAYHIAGHVPSCKWQYSRINQDYTPYRGDLWNSDLGVDLLQNCIGSTDPESEIVPKLNYQSLAYYYTTCMAFGLIDSVQKNLTIKKWKDDFGIFFYDIDTALGRDNEGNKSSYFAFSDYWFSNIDEYAEDGHKIDRMLEPTAIAVRTVNNGCTVYRDYSPMNKGDDKDAGYDIPSSYLFAIAKYTNCLDDYAESPNYISPQDIYATWRSKTGILSTADNFIDTYFASNLNGVPECLLNLNYRNKYLYSTNGTAFDRISRNLHGRGIEEVRDWLTGRLHILDAYFNLSSEDVDITQTYKEPKPTVVINNPDIYIIKDIFSGENDTGGIMRTGAISFTVTADDYSPLIIRKASSIQRYLLEKKEVPYEINLSTSNERTNFGGSQLWTSLNSINGFTSSLVDRSTFNFITDRIDSIIGDTGSVTTQWNIDAPFAKEIKLNSPNYSGALTIDDSAYNLDKIDISRSKISLSISDSKVTEINCANLNGANKLDIIRCNNLQTVNLSNANVTQCEISPIWTSSINLSNNRIKELTVTGNNNLSLGTLTVQNNGYLQKLTFSRFQAVNLNNASDVRTIICNDDPASTTLTSFTAQNCKKLTSISLPVGGLVELNLYGCASLTNITLKGSDFTKLRKLNLYGTKVKYITFDNGTDTSCLDLSRFINLGTSTSSSTSYVRLDGNSEVEKIRFKNVSGNPVYLLYTFDSCTKLERVYGNVSIRTAGCFKNLSNFSIHGSDLSTMNWHGYSVLNGTHVKHPIDIPSINSPSDYFWNSNNATNMTFSTGNATDCFSGTNCTLFDIYYVLSNLGSATDLSTLFGYNKNTDYGGFNIENGNNPDTRMFNWATNVTSLSFIFRSPSGPTKRIYLTSPTVVDGIVTVNDGLYSPLVNCSNFSGVFYGYTYLCDRFLFRRSRNNEHYIPDTVLSASMAYFNPTYVLNEPPSDFSWSTIVSIYSDVEQNTGTLTGFFDNISSLTNITGIFNGLQFIDYDEPFTLPVKITSLQGAFVTRNAKGTFVLDQHFVDTAACNRLNNIWNSFRVTESGNVTMELNNSTFSAFPNLIEVGYGGTGDFSSSDFRNSSFTGFNKTLPEEFPFQIFSTNTKLVKASAVFMNATSNIQYNNLKLPGNMFIHNPMLKDVSGLFYNLQVDYQLSDSGNFEVCTQLENVQYLFAQDIININAPRLTGFIPYKLFWHGASPERVKWFGTNERTLIPATEEEPAHYEYGEDIEWYKYVPGVKATISSMEGCFQHSGLNAYINTIPEVEYNDTYHPYKYVRPDKQSAFIDETNLVDNREYSFIWSFDGVNYPTAYTIGSKDNYLVLDKTVIKQGTGDVTDRSCYNIVITSSSDQGSIGEPVLSRNYIAPPDLLRYCKRDCNISRLFAGSGVSGWSSTYNGTSGRYNKYGYGITGRICPYMLKPVPDITSVSEMFKYCKKLSFYRIIDGDLGTGFAYMIPNEFFTYATSINNLSSMFEDTLQPQNADLSNVFKPLTSSININSIFAYSYWDSTDAPGSGGVTTELYQVFKTSDITDMGKAFCATMDTNTTDRVVNQKITFSDMFDSAYSAARYSNDEKYSNVFRGYSWIGTDSNERFGIKTLVDGSSNHNYKAWNHDE